MTQEQTSRGWASLRFGNAVALWQLRCHGTSLWRGVCRQGLANSFQLRRLANRFALIPQRRSRLVDPCHHDSLTVTSLPHTSSHTADPRPLSVPPRACAAALAIEGQPRHLNPCMEAFELREQLLPRVTKVKQVFPGHDASLLVSDVPHLLLIEDLPKVSPMLTTDRVDCRSRANGGSSSCNDQS